MGGLTALEGRYLDNAADIGIRMAPHEVEEKPTPHRKSMLRRIFSRRHKKETQEKLDRVDIDWAIDGRNQLDLQRTDTALAVLNFLVSL